MNLLKISTLAIVLLACGSAAADIRVLPDAFTLSGAESLQQLSVVKMSDNQLSASILGDEVELKSSNSDVVKIQDSVAIAVGNGTATITATVGDQRASSEVKVVGADDQNQWSFRNDVQNVLSRAGCNTGACHGALAGKGGFRLSLRGYDSQADFKSITREARGRRVELSDPGRSLLLAKPTAALPHKGGLKLDVDSRDYKIISQWIASGAKGPTDTDAKLERISVYPKSAMLTPGDNSRILVNAHYNDGRVVDVTTGPCSPRRTKRSRAWMMTVSYRFAAVVKAPCWFGSAAKLLWPG